MWLFGQISPANKQFPQNVLTFYWIFCRFNKQPLVRLITHSNQIIKNADWSHFQERAQNSTGRKHMVAQILLIQVDDWLVRHSHPAANHWKPFLYETSTCKTLQILIFMAYLSSMSRMSVTICKVKMSYHTWNSFPDIIQSKLHKKLLLVFMWISNYYTNLPAIYSCLNAMVKWRVHVRMC